MWAIPYTRTITHCGGVNLAIQTMLLAVRFYVPLVKERTHLVNIFKYSLVYNHVRIESKQCDVVFIYTAFVLTIKSLRIDYESRHYLDSEVEPTQ